MDLQVVFKKIDQELRRASLFCKVIIDVYVKVIIALLLRSPATPHHIIGPGERMRKRTVAALRRAGGTDEQGSEE